MNNLAIILSAIIAFAATLSAGIFIKEFKSHIGVVCAFSSGFFIALSIFDLLPNVLTLAPAAQIPLENLLLIAFAGFFLLFAVQRVILKLNPKMSMAETSLKPRIGALSTAEFCSHAFLEGIAIGVSFQLQFGLGVFVAIAVVSHDFCDGISTLALMLNSGNSLRSSFGMLFVGAIAPISGAASTLIFSVSNFFLVYALSFLMGSFLFIGGGMLLPDANKMNRPAVTAVFFVAGFLLLFALTRILGN
jgi:zinc transporter ZupT